MSDTTPLPIHFPAEGIIPAVVQDAADGTVLMVGFMNDTALARTRATGYVHFWSRSRQKLWLKGETSGHIQRVQAIYVNCDQNGLLIEVEQVGAVCHDGYPTCFYRRLEPDNALLTVRDRWFDPEDLYGENAGVAGVTTRWWGAYAYLRDNDLTDASGTSRALHGAISVATRVADELGELAGVLDGTHVHDSQRADAMLEAGQVCYWAVVEAVRLGLGWDDVRPDRALDRQPISEVPSIETLASLLRRQAAAIKETPLNAAIAHGVLSLIADVCVAVDILPKDIILRDLEELRERDYMAPYFAR